MAWKLGGYEAGKQLEFGIGARRHLAGSRTMPRLKMRNAECADAPGKKGKGQREKDGRWEGVRV